MVQGKCGKPLKYCDIWEIQEIFTALEMYLKELVSQGVYSPNYLWEEAISEVSSAGGDAPVGFSSWC